MIIIGRQFPYERALEIVQDEQYLDDVDFDEIRRSDILKKTGELNPNDEVKRYDIQEKRIGNRKINLRKRRELGVKNAGKIGDNKQNKKVHSKRRKIQAKTKDRFRLDN